MWLAIFADVGVMVMAVLNAMRIMLIKNKRKKKKMANKKMKENMLYDLADLFKLFGDSTRIRILYTLYEEELSVGEIAEQLGMTISAVSHQLRVLKQGKLVKSKREGKQIYYSLDDDHVKTIIAMGREYIEE